MSKKKASNAATVPENIVNELKCQKCKTNLSGTLVMLNKAGNFCSTCIDIGKPYIRNLIYEKLACNFKFPCTYRDCTVTLLFNNIRDHQINCEYKVYDCPIKTKRCWKGTLNSFQQHVKTKHKDLLIRQRTIFLLSDKSYNETLVLLLDEETFLVQTSFDQTENKYTFTVKFFGSPVHGGKYCYSLDIFGDHITRPFISEEKSVVPCCDRSAEEKHKIEITMLELKEELMTPNEMMLVLTVYDKNDVDDDDDD